MFFDIGIMASESSWYAAERTLSFSLQFSVAENAKSNIAMCFGISIYNSAPQPCSINVTLPVDANNTDVSAMNTHLEANLHHSYHFFV